MKISELGIMDAAEREQILESFNATQTPFPQHALLHELFEEQATRLPDSLAVEYEGQFLTYAALNARANRLARFLAERDVGPDQLVGLCVERGLEMVVAVLGILKAGGAYLPMDPADPPRRLSDVLADAPVKVLLTQESLRERFSTARPEVIALDGRELLDRPLPATNDLGRNDVCVRSHHLAYVIYTSGSTGRPKGVMVEHRHVVNLGKGLEVAYGPLGVERRVALSASLSFDASVEQLLQLTRGSTLVILPQEVRWDPVRVLQLVDERRIEHLDCTPSELRQWVAAGLLERPLPSLRAVMIGGEAIDPQLWAQLARCRQIEFYNVYGPTECTVEATIARLNEDDSEPHVGRPMSNRRLYVLDRHDEPVPIGVVGEIHIGGAGVARGYLNRPELTAERFVRDPFSSEPWARMYRTGDLGRWRADGTLEFLGRNDSQVKIRGHRIELGEIEARLSQHPKVSQAVALVREGTRRDTSAEKSLVAYVTRQEGAGELSAQELRTHLSGVLPDPMIPSAFVLLERFPLTSNGKLDRRALPAPGLEAYASRDYEAPQGEVEEVLAGIWQGLLQVERVGRRDNFFELGGHSLLIVQMLERLRRASLVTGVREVFESPTLVDLANALRWGTELTVQAPPNLIPAGCELITPAMLPMVELEAQHIERIVRSVPEGAANIQDIYPLTPLQEGLLFHHLIDASGPDPYARTLLLSLPSRERVEAFLQALRSVIARHDVLRTAVLWEQLPKPVQVVYRQAQLPVEEIVLETDRDPVEQLQERMAPGRLRLDLRQAPLMKVEFACPSSGPVATAPSASGPACYVLLQTHHLLCDNQSLDLLIGEVMSYLEGTAESLPEPVGYRHHVAQALSRTRTHDAQELFRAKLADIDEPTAPFGVLDVHGDGSRTELASEALESELAREIRLQARRLEVSVATLFHAAWALVVARTSGREDVVYGTVLLGRLQGSAGAQRILGMFINTLPLRLPLQELTVRGLVERTQREVMELLMHEHASLAVAQSCSAVARPAPLFSALLNYRHSASEMQADWSRAPGVEQLASRGGTNYPLVLSVDDLGEGFELKVETDPRIDSQRTLAYMRTALGSLIEKLKDSPGAPALSLGVLPEHERRLVMELFNDTRTDYPHDRLIHELFEEQVARTPEAIAVVYEEHSLTYAELNSRANQLAHYLRSHGCRVGEYIPIRLPRCLQMVVAQLAVLKSGGVHVPVDPQLPLERQEFIIRDCGALRILADQEGGARLGSLGLQWIDCDSLTAMAGDLPDGNLGLRVHEPHPAHVMYTSGSTGAPKGVLISHRGVSNLVLNNSYARFEPSDCIAHNSNPAFDAATFEIWSALLNGARLLILPQPVVLETSRLAAELDRHGVTILFQATALLNQRAHLASRLFSRLRYLFFGGEVVDPNAVRAVLGAGGPQNLVNLYGPTEITTFATSHAVVSVPEAATSVPIGRPIANAKIYILDTARRPAPVGVAGEIFIGGAGVALGYLNRPELTAQRFIQDPWSTAPQARLYRTGDLGRWRMDGSIEYLGRNDQQVKIRGFRIEPGEIEAQLTRDERVKETVVIARADEGNQKRLVAYVVPRDVATPPSADQLRSHLKALLPEYMVPSAFVLLERFPLTSNGKLDRRALPAPGLEAYASRDYEAPQGEVEEVLAGIWQGLLQVERVGRRDNFFELGGHSLLIVQMLERLRRASLVTGVREVFESPTLVDLANALRWGTELTVQAPPNLIPAGCELITPAMLPMVELEAQHIERIVRSVPEGAANIQDIYPLTPLQEGLLFHHLIDASGPDPYARTLLLSLPSRERVEAFLQALRSVIARHDVLRTAVLWEQLPKPVQVVYRQAQLPVEEIVLETDRDPVEQLQERMAPGRLRLDLRQAPLMKVEFACPSSGPVATAPSASGPACYVLLQTHHLLCDNQSLDLLIGEVMSYLEGTAESLPEPVGYRHHVAQALSRTRTHDAQELFRAKLADIDEPTAPFGVLDVHGDGSRTELASEALESELAREIRLQARRLEVSVATLFHAAWALVVARTSGREDVVYGTVLLGRLQGSAGAQRILGMFINTLPLRLPLQELTVRGLVERTQREVMELLMHEHASLAVAQSCSAVARPAPLFSALLNYRHSASEMQADWSRAPGVEQLASRGGTNYPLVLSVDDLGEGFELKVETDPRIDSQRTLAYMRTALGSLIEKLKDSPGAPALSLGVLPEHERRLVMELFNDTRTDYPHDRLIHELFEEQVARTPEAIAVVYEEHSLTYAELNSRANQMARYLREKGVRPEQLVGICVERSLEMVVGLLGILKAGGAYVPLDPNYPPERLAYILEDSAPVVLLAQTALAERVPVETLMVLLDGPDAARIGQQAQGNLNRSQHGLSVHYPAYVIYTSGSTGAPKGVLVEHQSVVNFLCSMSQMHGMSESDSLLAVTTLSFDIAGLELYLPLISGARVVLATRAMASDAALLERAIHQRAITIMQATPATWRMLLDSPWTGATQLRALCGGEALPSDLSKRLSQRVGGIWNLYGPTETTIWSTAWRVAAGVAETDPVEPIGRPIANTQIYVLDSHFEPVPIGVPGEIYIGGAGVARGYLNRPELTAERFVADQFSVEAQGRVRGMPRTAKAEKPKPGQTASAQRAPSRLYKTGDLGRWRLDGTLEYLGRNDHQVKIRGFRIELGEIEAQLRQHAPVKEAVVLAREDMSGGKRLVAYVTAQDAQAAPSVEDLREHLKGTLPEHMVPSAFVVIEKLPLTPNGKLDRRALPAPELGAYLSRQYEAPQGEVEEILTGIWQRLLQVERVGRWDNFFELGGHSLLALKLLYEIDRSLACALTVTDVYRHPTLRALATRIDTGAVVDEPVELAREAVLDSGIVAVQGRGRHPAQAVLLTGATGFVGRFLLAQLLRDTGATVYCLTRARSQQQAAARLRATLLKWDLWSDDSERRIVAVPGDLGRPSFGLGPASYETLSEEVDSIYHCATSMNHLETYAMAKPTNVDALRDVLWLAAHGRPKLVNYISTLSVFGLSSRHRTRVIRESTPIEAERHSTSDGYTASKWVGEKLSMIAMERGIACNIFRLGLVWADTEQGRYDELQREYRLLKSCLLAGVGIEGYRYERAPTPVDFVARAVTSLADRFPQGGGIFHIANTQGPIDRVFECCNELAATSLELLPWDQWIGEMKRLHQAGRSLPVVPLIEYAFSMSEKSLREAREAQGNPVQLDCSRTYEELERAGITLPPLNEALLTRCLNDMFVRDEELRHWRTQRQGGAAIRQYG